MTGPEGRKILGKLTSEQRKMLESGKEVTISTAFVKAEWVIKIEDGEIQRSLKIINLWGGCILSLSTWDKGERNFLSFVFFLFCILIIPPYIQQIVLHKNITQEADIVQLVNS